MGYIVNPANLGAVFVVPTQVVDKHIKLASGQQLKLLLWMLRHSNEGLDIDRLCKDLNFKKDDALDYMQYWIETGVILCDDEISAPQKDKKEVLKDVIEEPKIEKVQKEAVPQKAESSFVRPKKELVQITHSKPTREEILLRAEESEDIKFLLHESQAMLGRTIGYDGQCTLLMLHDTYGIPVEVILMIIEYAVSVGKSNFHYILAMGKEWGENEIDTIEKADEKISALRTVNRLWAEFSRMAGLSNSRPTRSQEKMFVIWSKDWKFSLDMIYLAYEKMTNNCRNLSFAYMNKILESWYNNGLKTVSDVEAFDKGKKNFSSRDIKKQRAPLHKDVPNNVKNSYSLGEFQYSAAHEPLVYNKNKKKI